MKQIKKITDAFNRIGYFYTQIPLFQLFFPEIKILLFS